MMTFKKLLFLALILCHYGVMAQVGTSSYIFGLYQAKNSSGVFAAVDHIKKTNKEMLRAQINALPANAKKQIIASADAALGTPWTLLTLSQFNEFKTTGNRVNYENNYFARRNKLNILMIGELVANDGRYLNEIVNGLGLICEESTWALPAHMSLQKAGNGLPDVNEPVIDLFASHTGMILSYAKYLFGDKFSVSYPLLNERIDAELKKRIFDPYLNRDDFWWMGFHTSKKMNNWNIFTNTNVLSSAILAEDDTNRRKSMIEKSMKSVDIFLNSYRPDGGCDEGPSYWGIAGGALIDYIDLLSVFSNHQLDFSKSELIHNIGAYIYKVHIDQNYNVNFADATASNAQDPTKVYKFGKLYHDKKLLEYAAYIRKINNGDQTFDLGNINGFVNSLAIRDEFKSLNPVAPQLKYAWLNDVQILTARQNEGSAKGLFIAVKGGNNAESHNHNDIGNFIVYKDGTPLIIDAGVGVYNKQTFGPDRYKIWNTRSDWHNCPTINGAVQEAGKSYQAKEVSFENKGDATKLSMELSAAYPKEAQVDTWKRAFIFQHQAGVIKLREDFKLSTFITSSSLSFLINGTVSAVAKGNLQIRNPQGKTISLIFDPQVFDFEIELKKIDDARLAASWPANLSRLILKRKSKKLTGSHQIEIRD